MKLLQNIAAAGAPEPQVMALANDADPLALAQDLQNTQRVDLHFPKFSDGRAFSQAWLLPCTRNCSSACAPPWELARSMNCSRTKP